MRAAGLTVLAAIGAAVGCEQLLGVHDIKGAPGTDGGSSFTDDGGQTHCVALPHFGASTRYGIPVSQSPDWVDVGLGDLDHDGLIDIAVTLGSDTVALKGDGSGGFQAYHAVDSVATPGTAVVISDLDGDGYADLTTCNNNSILVRRQDASHAGKFLPAINTAIGACPFGAGGLRIAKFNNDTYPDLFVSAQGSGASLAMLGTGSGGFTIGATTPRGTGGPTGIIAADIDGDSFDDILSVGNQIQYNQGGSDCSFTTAVTVGGQNNGVVGVGHYSGSAARLDIVAHADSSSGTVYQQTSPRSFTERSSAFGGPIGYGAGGLPANVFAVDLNNDGLDDIVGNASAGSSTSLPYGSAAAVMQCSPDVFEPTSGSGGTVLFGTPGALVRRYRDVNGDGKVDLIEVSPDAQYVVVWIQ